MAPSLVRCSEVLNMISELLLQKNPISWHLKEPPEKLRIKEIKLQVTQLGSYGINMNPNLLFFLVIGREQGTKI